jgi:hypothetical protein
MAAATGKAKESHFLVIRLCTSLPSSLLLSLSLSRAWTLITEEEKDEEAEGRLTGVDRGWLWRATGWKRKRRRRKRRWCSVHSPPLYPTAEKEEEERKRIDLGGGARGGRCRIGRIGREPEE